jgi:peptidoglycan/xylan/chitin deacetylase (PgdA/CDA1 family)
VDSYVALKLRAALRHLSLDALSAGQQLRRDVEADLQRNRVHILDFHTMAPSEEPEFRRLLEWLAEYHHFIGYTEAVDRVSNGPIDAPYVAVSFDDGLGDSMRAAEVLDEFDVKAIFFVCPSLMGSTSMPEIKAALRIRSSDVQLPMGWNQLERLVNNGHEIGGHSMSHVDLAQVGVDRLSHEIGKSFEVLRARLGDVRHFAWPFGRFENLSAVAARLVFDSGYHSCASGLRGCHAVPGTQGRSLCLRREDMKADTPTSHIRYFLARSSHLSSENDNTWPAEWREDIGA